MPGLLGAAGLPTAAKPPVFIAPGPVEGTWLLDDNPDAGAFRRCANLDSPAACNWLIPAHSTAALCVACSLNRTIPDLSIARKPRALGKVETAKRRLVAQLISLGLQVVPKSVDEDNGLAFDFVGIDLEGNAPTTGHANGLITLDIKEADDAHREKIRAQMREPYRTLLGHFRHEVGHYYWDRLIANSHWLPAFRHLFGDERASYADALDQHYQNGPRADWHHTCVSAYATMHPWEDWAETWAHYLHMMDAVDTALGFGMSAREMDLDYQPFPAPPSTTRTSRRRGVPVIRQRLDRTGRHAQRTVPRHGPAGFLPLRTATGGDRQAALHSPGHPGRGRQGG